MNYFNITIIALLLIGCKIAVPTEVSSEKDYKFTLGDKEFFPEENFKDFFKKKSDFKNNLSEGKYFVVLQFKDAPSKNEQYDMRQDITLIKSITKHTFIASFPKKIKKRTIKKFNVRAILPLSASMKIEKGLKKMVEEKKAMKINVVVAQSVQKSDLKDELEALGITKMSEIFQETSTKYMININEEQMMTIASWSNVIGVEVGGLR
ncbi:MAG: hypothetical protein ACPGXZ_10440 [Saprospiraceae bacterium]